MNESYGTGARLRRARISRARISGDPDLNW